MNMLQTEETMLLMSTVEPSKKQYNTATTAAAL